MMLAALAVGESRIEGLCDGLDLAATIAALRAMGSRIDQAADGAWTVNGVGTGALLEPSSPLDMANSGTSARLLLGLAASHPIRAIFTGDSSLVLRPMDRVAAPLRRIGARVHTAPGERLPLVVEGAAPALPRRHRIEVPSAQVKSALLFAGLNTPGITEVEEMAPTRDHLERLLAVFGGDIEVDGRAIALRGETELRPQHLTIPGDPSAAAFLIIAALIVPGSEVRIEGMCVNPRRTGLYQLLEAMGADFEWSATREVSGEPVADVTVRHSTLHGCDVPPKIAPSMIDEFPVFFIAAAFAEGVSRARGLAELRIKESDRIASMAEGLRAIGVVAEENEDGMTIQGSGGDRVPGGARIAARLDHRVAMAFAAAGLHAVEPIGVAGMDAADTSFPGFAAALQSLTAA
jgi:3-phosphoshikimate 1-carboxyvinyltransferase